MEFSRGMGRFHPLFVIFIDFLVVGFFFRRKNVILPSKRGLSVGADARCGCIASNFPSFPPPRISTGCSKTGFEKEKKETGKCDQIKMNNTTGQRRN